MGYRRILKRIANATKRWYQGEYVPPENDPSSQLFRLLGNQRYHWSARAARRLAAFYLEHWKWFWGFLIAVAGLFAALKKS
jgi:hypothetical protein